MARVKESLGVTGEEYEALLDASDHRCWICGEEERVDGRRLAIDHDHETGAVRGLLCTSCNLRLGAGARDWYERATRYLRVAYRGFWDCCHACDHYPAVAPASQRPTTPDGYTTFRYQCKAGHGWTCTYRTIGIPLAWMVDGYPIGSGWPGKKEGSDGSK